MSDPKPQAQQPSALNVGIAEKLLWERECPHRPGGMRVTFQSQCSTCLALALDESERSARDNPELDCTDLAHPAYWRGEEAGVRDACGSIARALQGDIAGTCREPLQDIRERVAAAVSARAEEQQKAKWDSFAGALWREQSAQNVRRYGFEPGALQWKWRGAPPPPDHEDQPGEILAAIVDALTQEGVPAWPGDGTGIVEQMIHMQMEARASAEKERDAIKQRLEDVYVKDSMKTREINILVPECRRLERELAEIAQKAREAEKEIKRLHVVTAWYEEKHKQRRAQLYTAMSKDWRDGEIARMHELLERVHAVLRSDDDRQVPLIDEIGTRLAECVQIDCALPSAPATPETEKPITSEADTGVKVDEH